METQEKRQLRSLVKLKKFRVHEPSISFKYPLLLIALIAGLLVFNSNEAKQKAPATKQTDTLETFYDFVERVLKERQGKHETYFLGNVSEKMQQVLKDSVQTDFKGYHWVISNYDVLHITIKHGNFKKERSRGQINVTAKDYQKIYSIINVPDNIKLSKSKQGVKSLELSKYINGFKYIYVVTISKKRLILSGKTMYIKKAPIIKQMPF